MKLDRRTGLAGSAAAFAAPLMSAVPARADAKRQALVDSSLQAAQKILTGKDTPVAAKYIQNARGVLIVPELVQGGLIFGLAGGRGTLMARGAGKDWSPPAFYVMGSGSVGVAAARLGRRFLGNDLNPEAVRITAERLREFGTGRTPGDPATPRPAAHAANTPGDAQQADLLDSIVTRT